MTLVQSLLRAGPRLFDLAVRLAHILRQHGPLRLRPRLVRLLRFLSYYSPAKRSSLVPLTDAGDGSGTRSSRDRSPRRERMFTSVGCVLLSFL